jgi:hypothetical protein
MKKSSRSYVVTEFDNDIKLNITKAPKGIRRTFYINKIKSLVVGESFYVPLHERTYVAVLASAHVSSVYTIRTHHILYKNQHLAQITRVASLPRKKYKSIHK